jgi:hypothetical protein
LRIAPLRRNLAGVSAFKCKSDAACLDIARKYRSIFRAPFRPAGFTPTAGGGARLAGGSDKACASWGINLDNQGDRFVPITR